MGHPDVVSWFVAPWILFCYILQKPKRYLTFIQSKSSFTVFMDYFPIPYAPCMEYLSTFIIYPINEPNVGKYTIHGLFSHSNFHSFSNPPKNPMIFPSNPIKNHHGLDHSTMVFLCKFHHCRFTIKSLWNPPEIPIDHY